MTKSKQQITYQTDSNGKKMLTNDIIKNTLIANTCNQKHTHGALLIIGGCFLLAIGIPSLFLGVIAGGLLLSIGGGLCLYFGIKKQRISEENKSNISKDNFRIIKTECIEFKEEYIEDPEGGGLFTYKHRFANDPSEEISLDFGIAQKGDVVYLVYLENYDKIGAYFNAREFTPSSDLIIEQTL